MARAGAVARQLNEPARPPLTLVRPEAEALPDLIPAQPWRRHLTLVPELPYDEPLRFSPFATITRTQGNKGDTAGVGASSCSCTWGSTTTAHNLLVAIILTRATGTNTPTFTAPSGWVAAPPSRAGASGGSNQDPSVQIWYLKDCGTRSGSESWSWTGTAEAVLYMYEYSGCDTTAPYDTEGNASNSSTSTNAGTGTTGAITSTGSLCIGGIAAKNQLRTFSSPQNGYTLVRQDQTTDATNANGIATAYLELIGGTAGGTQSTGLTINTASQNTGVLAVFKPAAAGANVTGAAALTGLGTMTVAGVRTRLGAASLTGLGTMTASGKGFHFGAASLTGLGTMTVAGVRTRLGAAALTGLGALTAAGTHTAFGMAALFGVGSLSAAGRQDATGAAALTGTGSMSASGVSGKFRKQLIAYPIYHAGD